MIIHGNCSLEVGKRYQLRIWDKDLNLQRHVPALVLEIATEQDYINYCKQEEVFKYITGRHGPNYYKISID